MATVAKRTDPTEAHVLKALQDAIAAGLTPDDDYWTTTELAGLTKLSRDKVNNVVRELMISGEWERAMVVRVSHLDGRSCKVTGYRPKKQAK